VAKDGWQANALATVDGVEVASADAAGFNPDAHLPGAGIREVDFFDAERPVRPLDDCSTCLHGL
jgi:hypothetical protein